MRGNRTCDIGAAIHAPIRVVSTGNSDCALFNVTCCDLVHVLHSSTGREKEHPAIVASIQYIPEAKDVRVLLHNPTNRYAATRLWVEAKVYGNTTSLGPAYSGETIWHLTPQFAINGHFSLEKPLRQVGKQFATMVAEANSENCTRQLRLSLRLEWEDEDGISGSYPQHLWYFDFRRNGFVYQVGGFES